MKKRELCYWQSEKKAEKIVLDLLKEQTRQNSTLRSFCGKLEGQTSTCLIDWLDHIIVAKSDTVKEQLSAAGFAKEENGSTAVFRHPGARLPRIVLSKKSDRSQAGIAIRVEDLGLFLQINSYQTQIEGDHCGPYRRAVICQTKGSSFIAVERRGSNTLQPSSVTAKELRGYLHCRELWQTIPRQIDDKQKTFGSLVQTAKAIIKRTGKDMAAHIICAAERDYWVSKNHVGRVQKMRQDTLGLGWANHDHHTFRSSRRLFPQLVGLFSSLGFEKRERFYAGKEAGWGAQVMENNVAGLSLFLDVDLTLDEIDIDFSQIELPELDTLGTVGLWCELHGDSILNAGLHHLAANANFNQLPKDLAGFDIQFMAPFSDFIYLKQAFSKGEMWPVDPEKLDRLVKTKRLTSEKADRFLTMGALGSHLENIQRREGYKGFNKKNVSSIIKETDPRN